LYEHFYTKGGDIMKIMNVARMALVGASTTALLLAPAIAGAQPAKNEGGGRGGVTATELGLYYGEASGLGTQSLQATITSIIRVALSLLGIVALVIILMGGFKWMTAAGSEEKVKEAKRLIFQGIIGMAIVLSAFAITTFVVESLSTAVGNAPAA